VSRLVQLAENEFIDLDDIARVSAFVSTNSAAQKLHPPGSLAVEFRSGERRIYCPKTSAVLKQYLTAPAVVKLPGGGVARLSDILSVTQRRRVTRDGASVLEYIVRYRHYSDTVLMSDPAGAFLCEMLLATPEANLVYNSTLSGHGSVEDNRQRVLELGD